MCSEVFVAACVEDCAADHREIVEVCIVCAPVRWRAVEEFEGRCLELFPRERQLAKIRRVEPVERRIEWLPECADRDPPSTDNDHAIHADSVL